MDLKFELEQEVSFPEYDNITLEEIAQIRDELNQLTEADNKLTIFQRIGFILDQFTKLLKGSYNFRFKEMNRLNEELNTMYNKVVDVMENNKEARYKLKDETWAKVLIYIATLIDSKNPNKGYRLVFANQCYDPEAIKKYVNNVITSCTRYNDTKQRDKALEENLIYFKHCIDDYSAWLDRYIPAISRYEYRNVNIEDALDVYKRNMEAFYAGYIYGTMRMIQTDIIYIQCMKKMYESMKLDLANDAKIIQFVNDVFGYILTVMTKGIEYDNKIFEVSQTCFKAYYNNISEIYDHIVSA